MPYRCKGLCNNEPKRKPNQDILAQKRDELGRYNNGWKRCSICHIFMKNENLRCTCCSIKLRTRAYKTKSKKVKLETVVRY